MSGATVFYTHFSNYNNEGITSLDIKLFDECVNCCHFDVIFHDISLDDSCPFPALQGEGERVGLTVIRVPDPIGPDVGGTGFLAIDINNVAIFSENHYVIVIHFTHFDVFANSLQS